MVEGSKHAFWQALVFTVIVFGVGLILGYFLEIQRANNVEFNLMNSEINVLDEQIRADMLGGSNISCDLAIKNTFSFADKIYAEGLKLEKYDSSSKFTEDVLLSMHKRYDLLRMIVWGEASDLRERCKSFHTIIYLFDYSSANIDLKAKQMLFSRLLADLKSKYPDEILLIPIAANLDISSVDLAKANYNVTAEPVLIIDNRMIVSEIITFEELEKNIFGENIIS